MIRAVIDTSTLVGQARRRDLQEAASLGLFEAIWSPWIIAELNRVLTWRAIERSGCDLSAAHQKRLSASSKAMMEYLTSTFTMVDPKPPHPPPWDNLSDPWDIPIWAAAKASGATHVVSENTSEREQARSALTDVLAPAAELMAEADEVDEEALLANIDAALRGMPPVSDAIVDERRGGP